MGVFIDPVEPGLVNPPPPTELEPNPPVLGLLNPPDPRCEPTNPPAPAPTRPVYLRMIKSHIRELNNHVTSSCKLSSVTGTKIIDGCLWLAESSNSLWCNIKSISL